MASFGAGLTDRRAVHVLGEALAGTGRPLDVTSVIAHRAPGRIGTEEDAPDVNTAGKHRIASGQEALSLAAAGVSVSVLRLRFACDQPAKRGRFRSLRLVGAFRFAEHPGFKQRGQLPERASITGSCAATCITHSLPPLPLAVQMLRPSQSIHSKPTSHPHTLDHRIMLLEVQVFWRGAGESFSEAESEVFSGKTIESMVDGDVEQIQIDPAMKRGVDSLTQRKQCLHRMLLDDFKQGVCRYWVKCPYIS